MVWPRESKHAQAAWLVIKVGTIPRHKNICGARATLLMLDRQTIFGGLPVEPYSPLAAWFGRGFLKPVW